MTPSHRATAGAARRHALAAVARHIHAAVETWLTNSAAHRLAAAVAAADARLAGAVDRDCEQRYGEEG